MNMEKENSAIPTNLLLEQNFAETSALHIVFVTGTNN